MTINPNNPRFIIICRDPKHKGRVFTEGELLTEHEAREQIIDWQGLGYPVESLLEEQPDGSFKPVDFDTEPEVINDGYDTAPRLGEPWR